jgi:LAO/AO transport system kinase
MVAMPPPSDPSTLIELARAGDRRSLARLISLVESGREAGDGALAALFPRTGRAWTVGVTGSPGAGKSTLLDLLIGRYRAAGLSVGVVVVDPSSPFSGGALLGDRVRMQGHVSDEGVFVRSMSTRGHLGGVADATAKVLMVLDAVGFDVVLIETVGVGQTEVEVTEMADTILVVVTPASGDDIQAAKAGLLEVGDVFCVNKADLPGADDIVRHLTQMLEMGGPQPWSPPIATVSARRGEGIELLISFLDDHRRFLGPHLDQDRASRLALILRRALIAGITRKVVGASFPPEALREVTERQIDPWTVARRLSD